MIIYCDDVTILSPLWGNADPISSHHLISGGEHLRHENRNNVDMDI